MVFYITPSCIMNNSGLYLQTGLILELSESEIQVGERDSGEDEISDSVLVPSGNASSNSDSDSSYVTCSNVSLNNDFDSSLVTCGNVSSGDEFNDESYVDCRYFSTDDNCDDDIDGDHEVICPSQNSDGNRVFVCLVVGVCLCS